MISTHFMAPHKLDERASRFVDVLARQAADYVARRQAEAALRASEEKYRSLFESIDEGFCVDHGRMCAWAP